MMGTNMKESGNMATSMVKVRRKTRGGGEESTLLD